MIVQKVRGVVQVIDSVFYPIRKNSRVTLTIDIGDGQAGGTAYTWEGVTVTGTPNFSKCPVNPEDASAVGTILHCTTKVVDIRPETNHTSVTYTLEGGAARASFPYGVQVAKDYGLAIYMISFIFIAQT
jgi:hypothetical protein